MSDSNTITWFSEWFDSPYYHILYKNRDDSEAEAFLDNALAHLQLAPNSKIADIACGRGRHSIYLNKKGFDVTGLDLSPNSIAYANQFANEHLRFVVQDMRVVYIPDEFDAVFNLFTSFGYFDDEQENYRAIEAMKIAVKENGWVMIDFMNTTKIVRQLQPYEVITHDEIDFEIKKSVENGFIIKDIAFDDNGESYQFQEKVKAIYFQDFLNYFEKAKLSVEQVFGNYQLAEYNEQQSDRMIFLLKPIQD